MNLEELQNKIIEKHKIKLDKDDPLLIMYSINQYMIEDINQAYIHYMLDLQTKMDNMSSEYDKHITDKANNMLRIYNKSINEKTVEYINNINQKTTDLLNILEKNIITFEKYKITNKYLTILFLCVILINVFLLVIIK